MKLSEQCARRPIATILLWACAVAAGVYGWATLPVSALPRYETPTIEVKARLSGASPATMAMSFWPNVVECTMHRSSDENTLLWIHRLLSTAPAGM